MTATAPALPLAASPTGAVVAGFALALALGPHAATAQTRIDVSVLANLEYREVGPYRGGRSAAVCGIPQDRDTYYFGACGGGVWKTEDGGRSWGCVSDGFFGGSIGAVAVSEWDPNVVYAGGGEKTIRGNVSHGDGVYRSTDAGRTWKKIGLDDSRHVCRIRVHPRSSDVAYAACLGHLFGPNEQRGVFRTEDGGATWQRVLFVDARTGCVDLVMDPTNPRILYACMWQVQRTPYSLESGGPGSGIHKSTDGGDTWTEITGNQGLPDGDWGISGISVSGSNPDSVYAIIENKDGGVFRSRDGGETWSKVNSERKLRQRAWYYTRICADPADEDVVYVLNVRFWRSKDGGRNYESISVPHGDNHDLWIDPNDPKRMIQSNDGGANVSFDGGESWTPQDTQPTAQMYRVSCDNGVPYRLMGGQQDNSTVRIKSRNLDGGSIGVRDWEPSAGGESGFVVAKPDDPDIVFGGSYGGFLVWVNHRTGERRDVHVWPDSVMGWGAAELKYRFQWNFPIFFSPHDPDTVYCAAQVLFKSTDMGQSWTQISPDLTRDDKTKQGPSGGPITKDNTSIEYYCTIFAAAESPHEAGVLWCGSDDGLIHVSRDGGESWNNVTPPTLPEWSMVNCIDVHPFEKGGLYVAATRYKLDDFRPYLFRTADYGATWQEIHAGIDPLHFTRAIRADPDRRGLLYCGTERGVYVSFDDGGLWQPLQNNLPVVPVTDLAVKERDLVVATQGRGYWILDDLTPLHQIDAEITSSASHLFAPRAAMRGAGGGRFGRRGGGDAGANPRSGVVFRYLLAAEPAADATFRLEVMEASGDAIRTFRRQPARGRGGRGGGTGGGGSDREGGDGGPRGAGSDRVLPAEKGFNEYAWDMRYEGVDDFPGMILWNRAMNGPLAVPGMYKARLTVGDRVHDVPFEIVPDPRSSATAEDYHAQFEFLTQVRDKLNATHAAMRDIRDVRTQIGRLKKDLDEGAATEELRGRADSILEAMTGIEKELYQTRNESRQDPLNYPIRLNDKLAALNRGSGGFGPTRQHEQVRQELTAQIDAQLERLERIFAEDVPALNRLARAAGVEAIQR